MILFAITVHEYMHARMALFCGDPTAKQMGRITLNPLAHLDPIGALCLLFAPIGWGKPVPVNPFNLRDPKRDDIIISIAGPASNIAIAIVIGIAIRVVPWPWEGLFLYQQHLERSARSVVAPSATSADRGSRPPSPVKPPAPPKAMPEVVYNNFAMLFLMLQIGLLINIGLAVFNMLPLFPLDGSHVVKGCLSGQASIRFEEFSRYAPGILMGLILFQCVFGVPLLTSILMPPAKFLIQTIGGSMAMIKPPPHEYMEMLRDLS